MNGYKKQPISDDDVVIVGFSRTALTKAKRGAQKDTPTESMLVPVLKAVVQQANLDPKLVEDICVGNVSDPGAAAMTSRMAMFLAGFPETTCLSTQNRFCSSGLQSVATIANAIKNRQIAIGIGAGVESMSTNGMGGGIDPNTLAPAIFEHEKAQLCLMPMGMTSENVAEKFGITRQQQDQMAVESH